jgi:RNA polymerase subunit RPABC4/transcription elongation factor Spt4
MSDRRTPLLIMGILCVVGGFALIFLGIERWHYVLTGTPVYRLNEVAYLGIVVLIAGVILLVLAFFTKDLTPKAFVCPQCGTRVLPTYKVCPKCGAYFKKQCANCKAEIDSTINYCPYCGSTNFAIPGQQI